MLPAITNVGLIRPKRWNPQGSGVSWSVAVSICNGFMVSDKKVCLRFVYSYNSENMFFALAIFGATTNEQYG